MVAETPNDRERVLRALDEAWRDEAGAKVFGLRYLPDRIHEAYGAWVVPVASGVGGGSAFELLRVINRLEDFAASRSQLDVSLFLDPFAPLDGTKNGK